MKAKIEWVHDDFDGPFNGVATIIEPEIEGTFWFTRVGDNFEFIQLTSDEDKFVFSCHKQFCEETGKPVMHGDPYIIRSLQSQVKMEFKPDPDIEGYEGTTRGLDNVVKAQHSFNPEEIRGDIFAVLKKQDILNYNIPRTAKFV